MEKCSFVWPNYINNNISLNKKHPVFDSIHINKLACVLGLLGKDVDFINGYTELVDDPRVPSWFRGNNNHVFIKNSGERDFSFPVINNSHFAGNDSIPKNCYLFLGNNSNYTINLIGDNTLVFMSDSIDIKYSDFSVGNGLLFLGDSIKVTSRLRVNCRNGGAVVIEDDALISSDVKIFTDDCHTLYSIDTGERLNPFGGVVWIKSHVWIGASCFLMGDLLVNQNCIIGANSFLRGKTVPENCSVAGTPARIIRDKVSWDFNDFPGPIQVGDNSFDPVCMG